MKQVYLIKEDMILERLHFSVQYANFDNLLYMLNEAKH